MALALKLALFQVTRSTLGIRPIVILDDVFAQLDDARRAQILAFANQQDQVLITAASPGDIPEYEADHANHVIDVGSLAAAAQAAMPEVGAVDSGIGSGTEAHA